MGYNSGDRTSVVDASFVKLRELRLGWAVPQTLLSGLSGYRMNVALVGRNLWMHANAPNIDPETAFSAGNQQGSSWANFRRRAAWASRSASPPERIDAYQHFI